MKCLFTNIVRLSDSAIKLAGLLILASVLLLPGLASAQDGSQQHLSHKELKSLIQKATTRQDHLRIAAYYRAEASRLRQQASEHADLESAYANRTLYSPKGYPSAYEHCKSFAESMGRGGKDAEALAEAHQRMANQVKH